ncbi:70 kDa peptidyl-prolyl isomerase-like [Chenopodium quinoa]|uniref:70 kDa peptidyl-prolyl isomerase-like n=1 Tax=Chenopodium quinoa TaxID=63459 RepID=UPI000B7753FD|nr:70 kDa peptidyl-prolyl isomerase-like [Chenopodium quinoa]
MDYKPLIDDLMVMHLNDDYDDTIVNFALNNCSRDIYNQAQWLKDEGNVHFKNGEVVSAGAKYDRGLKFLCFGLPSNADDSVMLWNLAIVLELNLAACALKVHDYNQTKKLCSLVLKFDGSNVKSFYRRASAEIRLYQLEEAYEDLGKAAKIEPNNKDILRELERLTGLRGQASKLNGKRGAENSDLTHCTHTKKGKASEPLVSLVCNPSSHSEDQSGVTSCLPTTN